MRFTVLLLLASAPAIAGNWRGYLVDSKCFAAEERNVSPGDIMPHSDSDMDEEIRYCVAKAKTRNFAVVQEDWSSLKFDPAGNAKAAELIGRIGKKPFLRVDVKGELSKDTIKVESISVETPGTRSTPSSSPKIARE